jgi:hypothetical protein
MKRTLKNPVNTPYRQILSLITAYNGVLVILNMPVFLL